MSTLHRTVIFLGLALVPFTAKPGVSLADTPPHVIKQERQPTTSPDSSRVTLSAGQAATVRYVDQHCNGCSSSAVAPADMCEHHGPRVACDFAIWTKADTRQCDGRLVISKAHGKLVVKLKGHMNCHGTYVLKTPDVAQPAPDVDTTTPAMGVIVPAS